MDEPVNQLIMKGTPNASVKHFIFMFILKYILAQFFRMFEAVFKQS
jgi:hypothetical protein